MESMGEIRIARRAGIAVHGPLGFASRIRDISNSQFRPKCMSDATELSGNMGIGVISDYEDQPLVISSHLGQFAIATVSVIAPLASGCVIASIVALSITVSGIVVAFSA